MDNTPENPDVDHDFAAYGSAATGTLFDWLPADQIPRAQTPVTRFSIEHWLYLARRFPGRVPEAPTELSPFPAGLHSDLQLATQLREWGYTGGDEGPTPELTELLTAVTSAPQKLWGQVRFPQAAFTSHLDLPPEALAWGLSPDTTVVPRVPFLVARNGEVVYLLTSAEEGLTVVAAAAGDDPDEDFATALLAVTDPDQQWRPAPFRRTALDAKTAAVLDAVPELGTDASTLRQARTAAETALDGALDRATRDVVDLLAGEVTAIAQAVLTGPGPAGEAATTRESVGMVMAHDDSGNPISFTVSPRRWAGADQVVFDTCTVPVIASAVSRLRQSLTR
jgi:hypothetical protein